MRAAVYHGSRDIRIEHLEVPEVGPGELLIEVHAAGICGTDASEWSHGPTMFPISTRNARSGHLGPMVPGHEFGGRVAARGHGVEGFPRRCHRGQRRGHLVRHLSGLHGDAHQLLRAVLHGGPPAERGPGAVCDGAGVDLPSGGTARAGRRRRSPGPTHVRGPARPAPGIAATWRHRGGPRGRGRGCVPGLRRRGDGSAGCRRRPRGREAANRQCAGSGLHRGSEPGRGTSRRSCGGPWMRPRLWPTR